MKTRAAAGVVGILWIFALTALGPALAAQERLALVIGNGAYGAAQLETPRNDAELIARTLTKVGFTVTRVFDADLKTMNEAILEFSRKLKDPQTVGLFYYAGHAIDLNGTNHLIPIGARIEKNADLGTETVNVTDLLATMERRPNGLNLFIFDASRMSLFHKKLRLGRGGLSGVGAPGASLVAFAAEPAEVSAPPTAGYSLFTASLADAIVKPGQDLEDVFAAASKDVETKTSGGQKPWWRTTFVGKFSFTDPDQPILTGDASQTDSGGLKTSQTHDDPGEQTLAANAPEQEDASIVPDIQRGILIAPSGERVNAALQNAPVTECDVLAASPADGGRVSKPVPYTKLAREAIKAVEACRIAVARHPGISRLEFQLALSLHADQQFGEAVAWYGKAARRNYPVAMFNLGLMYDQGSAIKRDLAKANDWYRKAADRGQASAMWNLAINLDGGRGGEQDGAGAANYLLKALKAGHRKAQRSFQGRLAQWKETTRIEVQRHLKKTGYYKGEVDGRLDGATLAAVAAYVRAKPRVSAQKPTATARTMAAVGNPPAHECDELAASPADETRVGAGVPYDTLKRHAARAVLACRQAVTAYPDVSRFEFQLGLALHADDQPGEAAGWFKKAAIRDHGAAMYNLAVLHDNGEGIERDHGLANFWYRKAADKNQVSAMWNFAINMDEGNGTAPKPAVAARYLLKAYGAGHEKAGSAFEKGLKEWQKSTRREVEQLLRQAGHYSGPVDGDFNDAARAAAAASIGRLATATAQAPDPAATESERPTSEEPATATAEGSGLHQCDRLAADPGDADRRGEPVSTATLRSHAETAIAACRSAAAEFPETARYAFQLGRALHANDEKIESLTWYSKAAEANYTAAIYNLAVAYDKGDGVAQNQELANRMYRKAADLGRSSAMWNLAINLDLGQGGDTDPSGAAQYLLKAMLAGHPKAREALSSGLTKWKEATRRETQRILKKEGHYSGPINGQLDAETQTALTAYSGGPGVQLGAVQPAEEADAAPAAEPEPSPEAQPGTDSEPSVASEPTQAQTSADSEPSVGSAPVAEQTPEAPQDEPEPAAQTEQNTAALTPEAQQDAPAPAPEPEAPVVQNVGVHECDRLAAHPADTDRLADAVKFASLKGQLPRAISVCREATSEYPGVSRFEFQLGRALSADQKDKEAVTWYTKAAERDYTAAVYNLALSYDEGRGIEKNPEEANRLYRRAADKGRVSAMWNLAINLDEGLGGAQDGKTSAKYLLLAYAAGHRKAVDAFKNGLRTWDKATRVEVQRILEREGYYKGQPDGSIDRGTRIAARAYREDR